MKWFLNLLKGIWRGITKTWSWVASKIKNIFSSKKNSNSEPDTTTREGQNQSGQEGVVITPDLTQKILDLQLTEKVALI